jgi:hypothetical protein
VTWLDDLEERLVRAGARGFGQQLADQVGRALGRPEDSGSHGGGDVWDVATHEHDRPDAEPPECAWCPVCRAIRLSQHAGPGLAGHMSGAADALATAAQDALGLLDDILSSSADRRDGPSAGPPARSEAGTPESTATPATGRPPGDAPGSDPRPSGTAPGFDAGPPEAAPGSDPRPPGNASGPGEEGPAPGEPENPWDGPASGS